MLTRSLDTAARTFGLVVTSISVLPCSLLSILLIYITRAISSGVGLTDEHRIRDRRRHHWDHDDKSYVVLVTGVGMAKGLALARAFHLCGHHVIGADFESQHIPCSGRYSKALSKFHPLVRPTDSGQTEAYVASLIEVVETEHVDLWVSCSGVGSAIEDARAKEAIERRGRCACIQFDVETTSRLHEKDSFMREVKRLGLPAPETHDIKSVDDALRILSNSESVYPDRKFVLKPVGVDDAYRGDMTLFPLKSQSRTKQHLFPFPICPTTPWILQEFIPGGEEYCTHALVVRGEVRCFVACASSELLMHYWALPSTSALSIAFLNFTQEFVARSRSPETWTGHLSFDFMVQDCGAKETGLEKKIYAIECNPRAHTAVVLFDQYGPHAAALVDAYISALRPVRNGLDVATDGVEGPLVVPPRETPPRYWLGHDLVTLVLHRACLLAIGQTNLRDLIGGCAAVAAHIYTMKEGTFASWDPWPAIILYHVYWPMTILSVWWKGGRWSRLNVSTTKMFNL